VQIPVLLVYSPSPRVVQEVELLVDLGCTVGQALQRSGILVAMSQAQIDSAELGVWGRKALAKQVLRANDRVEIYRPLTVDPKVARRERFARQGAKTAGLFAKRRAGAKAGY
jgi:putative ubiquitin-RnfH superfamily antitoxin RatB of RatAB toxin-antitoxin module